MAGANETELREAFKLFDADGDGMIDADELKTLITKVGGEMADAEAKALIHAADKDGNEGIDFEEFAQLWTALHGAEEVRIYEIVHLVEDNAMSSRLPMDNLRIYCRVR